MGEERLKKVIYILMIISFILGISLVSYGFYYDIKYVGKTKTNINTCSFDLSLDEKDTISLLSEIPINSDDIYKYPSYKFSIKKNNSNCDNLTYTIKIVDYCDICSDNNSCNTNYNCDMEYRLDPKVLEYQLITSDNTIIEGKDISKFSETFLLQDEQEFELRVWISSDSNENDLYVYENGIIKTDSNGKYIPKSYQFKINVILEQKSKECSQISYKYGDLNGDNKIDKTDVMMYDSFINNSNIKQTDILKADINKDNKITIEDKEIIEAWVNNLDKESIEYKNIKEKYPSIEEYFKRISDNKLITRNICD